MCVCMCVHIYREREKERIMYNGVLLIQVDLKLQSGL